jgi:hypothetical protein
MKIITHYWAKPIPTRRFDWSATFESYEPGDAIGYGSAESAAIQDLLEQTAFRNARTIRTPQIIPSASSGEEP